MEMLADEPEVPQPAPVPASPAAPDNAAATAEREEKARVAQTDRSAVGRKSTIVAGMKIASEAQAGRGLLSQAKRSAARESMGL